MKSKKTPTKRATAAKRLPKRRRPAKVVKSGGGLVATGEGWFVVNAGNARWAKNERFGRYCDLEGRQKFPHLGVHIHVLDPGQPNCHYHGESNQEDFLVLSGRCRLLIEGREILLKAWDFVHCPPMAEHVFVGAGRGPCAILMMGARNKPERIIYPVSELARKYGASAKKRTAIPKESYAGIPPWKVVRGKWPLR